MGVPLSWYVCFHDATHVAYVFMFMIMSVILLQHDVLLYLKSNVHIYGIYVHVMFLNNVNDTT